jgi:hypothetical protein
VSGEGEGHLERGGENARFGGGFGGKMSVQQLWTELSEQRAKLTGR